MSTQPQRCSVRRYATEGRNEAREKVVAYVFSCSCGVRKSFASKSKRNREAAKHG